MSSSATSPGRPWNRSGLVLEFFLLRRLLGSESGNFHGGYVYVLEDVEEFFCEELDGFSLVSTLGGYVEFEGGVNHVFEGYAAVFEVF